MTCRMVLTVSCFLVVLAFAPSTQAQDLEAAYKKEYTYLEAQKRALTERLADLKRQSARKVRGAQAEVDRLQGRVLSLGRKAATLEAELQDATRSSQAVSDDADALANTLEQARASLKDLGVTLPEVPESKEDPGATALARAKRLDEALGAALSKLETFQGTRTDEGDFFGVDGTKLTGKRVHIGRVASFGVAGDNAGALAPAGEGRYKIWSADASGSARGLVDGTPPQTLKLFLYENLAKNVEERQEKTWAEFMEGGGLTGWVIAALGALGALLVVIRVGILLVAGAGSRRLFEQLEPHLVQGEWSQALALARSRRSSVGRVMAATIGALERPRDQLEDVVAEALLYEAPRLERFGAAITVFAAVAPLLGLLGTVTGMISTFDIITEFGTGDPKMLSGGISEALITTQLGLIVAIPLLLLGNMTSAMSRGVQTTLERGALRVMNLSEQGTPSRGEDV